MDELTKQTILNMKAEIELGEREVDATTSRLYEELTDLQPFIPKKEYERLVIRVANFKNSSLLRLREIQDCLIHIITLDNKPDI